MNRLLLVLGLVAFGAARQALAFGAPEHSQVETEAKGPADAKEFVLKIAPKANMVVNFDAPWKLEVKTHDGLTLTKTTYVKADMDEKLPGFVVKAKADKPTGALEFSLTAFVCTKDKTQCFREVHAGKVEFKS